MEANYSLTRRVKLEVIDQVYTPKSTMQWKPTHKEYP